MPNGTVKFFNAQKGYGFISPDGGGGKDAFVHISAVERSGITSLNEGDKVSYELETGRDGKVSSRQPQAAQITSPLAARLVTPDRREHLQTFLPLEGQGSKSGAACQATG